MKRKLICSIMSIALVCALFLCGCSTPQEFARETVVKISEAARVEDSYKTIDGTIDLTSTRKTDSGNSVTKTNLEILTKKTGDNEETDVFTYTESDSEKSLEINYLRDGKTYVWEKNYYSDDEGFKDANKTSLISERNAEKTPELKDGGESTTAQISMIYDTIIKVYEDNKKEFASVSDNLIGGLSDLLAIEATKTGSGYTVTLDVKKGLNNVFDTIISIIEYAEKKPEITFVAALQDKNSPLKTTLESFVGDIKAKDFEKLLAALEDLGLNISSIFDIKAKDDESLLDFFIRQITTPDEDGDVYDTKFVDVINDLLETESIAQAKSEITDSRKQIDELFPDDAIIEVELNDKYVVKKLTVKATVVIGKVTMGIDAEINFNREVNPADVSALTKKAA